MSHAQRMMDLFAGLTRAYGTYAVQETTSAGKHAGRAVTVQQEVTLDLWEKHLAGEQGLGIVPIRDDSTVQFGAVDVDVYNGALDLTEMTTKVDPFPVVLCRSKSGGAHIYLFTKEPVPATIMQRKLRELAMVIGHGQAEIFPKQVQVDAERGDIGNWINMPYFGGENSTRYAMAHGRSLTLEEFLELALSIRCTLNELKELKFIRSRKERAEALKSDNLEFSCADGPPCLEYLLTEGFPEGTRNSALFNIGVYLRSAFPDDWEGLLETVNHQKMDPPLKSAEVQVVIKSLKRKDYQYTCDQPPIQAHCNRQLCLTRRYGVGLFNNIDVDLTAAALAKIDTEPPRWILYIDKHRIDLDTEDIYDQRRFRLRVMERLHILLAPRKDSDWRTIINKWLETVNVIEAPAEASPRGQLWEHFETFCRSSAQARHKDELLLGRPYTEGNLTYFRMQDFMEFLERKRFKKMDSREVTAALKNHQVPDWQIEHRKERIKGRPINLWVVPAFVDEDEPFAPPIQPGTEEY